MTFHIKEGFDLADGQVLPIAEGDKLVKGTEQFVGILNNFAFVQRLACASHYLCEQV